MYIYKYIERERKANAEHRGKPRSNLYAQASMRKLKL